jgi:hypothetical protein
VVPALADVMAGEDLVLIMVDSELGIERVENTPCRHTAVTTRSFATRTNGFETGEVEVVIGAGRCPQLLGTR